MAKYFIQDETLTNLADKIRVLNGTEDTMTPAQMDSNLSDANNEVDAQSALIDQLSEMLDGKAAGGDAEPVLQDKTVTPTTSKQTITADDEYDGLNVVTVNAIPSSYIKPTTTKAATTYTPTTTNQTIAAGTYLSGTQTIKGDSNLVAGNIKSGVSIFGVAGSYEGSGNSGSGSGGTSESIETCTVTLNGTTGKSDNLVYHCVENGEIVCKTLYTPSFALTPTILSSLGHDLSKVVKGSYLVFGKSTTTSSSSNVSISGEVQLVGDDTQSGFTVGYVFKINGDCSISIS